MFIVQLLNKQGGGRKIIININIITITNIIITILIDMCTL